MIRRTFLDRLLSLLSGLFFLPTILLANNQNYIFVRKDGRESRVPYIKKYGHTYISLVDFAQSGSFGFFTNEARRKTVLYVGRDKVKFTAENSFIILNDRIIQI